MYDDDYGMCCSEEMARQCAKDYEGWEKRESRKELIEIILLMVLFGVPLIILIIIFG